MEEYIPKLHIHQHSLLTRKVFFRHDFLHWSSSLYQLDHLRLQVFFVFKSSSSSSHLDLDHLSIWIIIELDMDHHITSSLDLDHHSIITGLDLDHHSIWIWIWIISRSGSPLLDLDHHLIWISWSHHSWI